MFKRLFDLTASLIGLVILLPLFGLLGILIQVDSPGPVFYLANRIGKNGKPFKQYKFRTMTPISAQDDPRLTTANDRRITRLGRWLRRYRVDELPQLINVIKGEMSLVGPRPEDPYYVAFYTSRQREILRYCPGITSPASIKFRNEESLLNGHDWETFYVEKILPEKLGIDLAYMQTRHLGSDILTILQTLAVPFSSDLNGKHKPDPAPTAIPAPTVLPRSGEAGD